MKDIFQAKFQIEHFFQSIGLVLDFSNSTISTVQDIESILTNISMERLANNPRIVSYDIVKKILLSKFVLKNEIENNRSNYLDCYKNLDS